MEFIDFNLVKIMKRYRDEKIPIDKFELSMDIPIPTGYLFYWIDKWLDIALLASNFNNYNN